MSPYDDGWLYGLEAYCARPCLRGKHRVMPTIEEITEACAEAAHEMNRIYCLSLGDTSQLRWDAAPDWQKDSARKGVAGAFAGNGPKASHESWMAEKQAAGWIYGPIKDPIAKTHPCMVPYDQLAPEQQKKDDLFLRSVQLMGWMLGCLHGSPMIPGIVVRDEFKVSARPA